ncbi:hypothetical protein DICVIV_11291 [Dictyocaulus viviparus]|uniref:Uncharacterized protein n=1 Tax=Dictyocaulus viviparus TaxID=29172 RepID=A0A0D8XK88_DICVI|nr:hypothetical protein DICVIV_11291 [Dictyocaulus viviparus]
MLQRGRQPKSAAVTPVPSGNGLDGSPRNIEVSNGTSKRDSTKEGKVQSKKSNNTRGPTDKKLMQITAQQEELSSLFESARKFGVDLSKYEQKTRLLNAIEISELKRIVKSSRTQERELAREAKKMKIKARHQWQKKRDDLECDDLKVVVLCSYNVYQICFCPSLVNTLPIFLV